MILAQLKQERVWLDSRRTSMAARSLYSAGAYCVSPVNQADPALPFLGSRSSLGWGWGVREKMNKRRRQFQIDREAVKI